MLIAEKAPNSCTSTQAMIGQRIDTLTPYRFYAAFAVFAFHASLHYFYSGETSAAHTAHRITSNLGNFGVTFFFVLSGFVLMWSRRERDSPGSFLMRRIVRIYPLHLTTLAIAIFAGAASPIGIDKLALNATLIHSWVPNADYYFSFNFPSWSISTEMFFYALFPVLSLPVLKIASRWVLPAIGGFIVLAIIVNPVVSMLFQNGESFGSAFSASPVYGYSELQIWFLYAFPATRLADFIIGMLLARLFTIGAAPMIRPWVAFIAVGLIYTVSLWIPLAFQLDSAPVLAAVILITAITRVATTVHNSAPPKLMIRLGEISFAFYLIHEIVLKWARRVIAPDPINPIFGFSLTACVLLISLGFAWILNILIEKPFVRMWARRTHPALDNLPSDPDTLTRPHLGASI